MVELQYRKRHAPSGLTGPYPWTPWQPVEDMTNHPLADVCATQHVACVTIRYDRGTEVQYRMIHTGGDHD